MLLCLALAVPKPAPADGCAAYERDAVETGRLPAVLPELSGLAASRRHPGIYWAHNDSGSAPVLYAIRESGALLASFALRGTAALDPEDVAVGPCASGSARSCVYLADTGDNRSRRRSSVILRVEEPDELRDATLPVVALPFRYPDGPHDTETLLVDPRTAELYVVTKAFFSLGDLHRLDDLGAPGGGRAVALRTLYASGFDALTTGGSVHPSGERVLLRTYRGVWEFRRPGARNVAEVLATTPVRVPDASERQGEAVAYTADGSGYVLGGEGEKSPLFRVGCRPLSGSGSAAR